MKSNLLFTCFFLLVIQLGMGQMKEPVTPGLSRSERMTALIDSLEAAGHVQDTARIIMYASVLTTSFHSARMRDRSRYYFDIALSYSRAFSDPTLYPEVCNRGGMLVGHFRTDSRDQKGQLISEIKMIDSVRWWHKQAIALGIKHGKYGTAGWGYRGVLQSMHQSAADGIDHHDSIDFYYEKAIEMSEMTGDSAPWNDASHLFARFLIIKSRFDEVQPIIQDMWDNGLWEKDNMRRQAMYNLLLEYTAGINNLDTLVALHKLQSKYFRDIIVADHNSSLYEMDQKFQVTKTQNTLEETESRLGLAQSTLTVVIVAMLGFFLLSIYLFSLSRKNKRLSLRNELLLKEQNHRVKNNLQMISSLLSLQSQKLLSSDAKDALNESQTRINSVALLHRMLYEGEQIGQVDIKEYLHSLLEEIQYAVPRSVKIDLAVSDKMVFSIEKATSIGLIVNELVTNSIKHVPQEVELSVGLDLVEYEGQIILTYSDNGSGIDHQVWETSQSFGNQLIRIQSEQLNGTYQISSYPGFQYKLKLGA